MTFTTLFLFQYDCLNAPLNDENDDNPFAWWTDRHGNTHKYWTGDGQEASNGCQCSLKVRKIFFRYTLSHTGTPPLTRFSYTAVFYLTRFFLD